jgi:hypothetical protein
MTTLSELQEDLILYKAAEKAILEGSQSYTIKDRTFNRADLNAVITQIDRIRCQIANIENGGGIRVRRILPRDL